MNGARDVTAQALPDVVTKGAKAGPSTSLDDGHELVKNKKSSTKKHLDAAVSGKEPSSTEAEPKKTKKRRVVKRVVKKKADGTIISNEIQPSEAVKGKKKVIRRSVVRKKSSEGFETEAPPDLPEAKKKVVKRVVKKRVTRKSTSSREATS